jgi:protein SCO1/2
VKTWIPVLALLFAGTGLAGTAASPLPGDSVYQLEASLTDASGRALEWRSRRGKPRRATLLYNSSQ